MERQSTSDQKGKRYPMLLGKPSPSMARMKRMDTAELEVRIGCLAVEAERVDKRIQRLRALPGRPDQEIRLLEKHRQRLIALQDVAREQLAEKQHPAE